MALLTASTPDAVSEIETESETTAETASTPDADSEMFTLYKLPATEEYGAPLYGLSPYNTVTQVC